MILLLEKEMARETREWHPEFAKYMDLIINHPNYKGLCIIKKKDGSWSWFGTKKTEVGKSRIAWCEEKAKELGFKIEPGLYANVMLAIHPTKWKVCQTCGRSMSLYYHYPNANLLKSILKRFGVEYTDIDHISDIWADLVHKGFSEESIIDFFVSKADLRIDKKYATKESVIDALEKACRTGDKKLLGPGAMSNFPDRFDGFHTYNRCCRAEQDKGRSKENLKSYTKDRRAYEYWSDGNVHAANQFMGSDFFNGVSADHIGPISLGFVHDPHYLQPMPGSDNSSKRDRLQYDDIEKIIETYSRTGIYPMSWQSRLLWEYIKANYETHRDYISIIYRDALKQNMSNYMFVLWYILENTHQKGEDILEKAFLALHYADFDYSYQFNELGEIVQRLPRHFTDRNDKECERYKRIAVESIYDYNDKANRNLKPFLTSDEMQQLDSICKCIAEDTDFEEVKCLIMELMEHIQRRLIEKL